MSSADNLAVAQEILMSLDDDENDEIAARVAIGRALVDIAKSLRCIDAQLGDIRPPVPR